MTQAEYTVSIDCIFLMLTWTRILVLNSKHIKLTSFLRKREKIVSQIIGKVKRNKHTDYESYLTFITTFNFTLHFCRALKAAGSAIWREIFRYSHGLRSQLVADWLPASCMVSQSITARKQNIDSAFNAHEQKAEDRSSSSLKLVLLTSFFC